MPTIRLKSPQKILNTMRPALGAIAVVVLFVGSLAGCLSGETAQETLNLVVTYEHTNGTIVEYYEDGQQMGMDTVVLRFDFSQTTSDRTLETFGVNRLDGSPGITVDASQSSEVLVEFTQHGLHELAVFATDDLQQAIASVTVRIEWRVEWLENGTNDPLPLTVDTKPANGGPPPAVLIIHSNVENPALINNIGGGQEVEITWGLIDDTDDACQSQNGVVDDGETITWKTVHFNTFEVHKLNIEYNSGQDAINIDQHLSVEYEALETPPNA